ncbi:MAG: CgeB family protein [Methylococcales bacterium]
MKILCIFGEHNYGDPTRGHGYEYSNFLPALRNLGHEVDLFDSFGRSRYADFSALNRALLEKVDEFCPDLVFCVLMGYEVWLETLVLIRESGARLIDWGTDDSWKYEQFSRYVAPAFDVWITTSYRAWRKAQRDGLNNFILSQWAARADSLAEPLAAIECRYPVSFVGSAYGNRSRWIAALAARGIEIACFGYGWPAGAVAAEDIPRIVRESVVSLNFGDSGLHFRGLLPYRSRQIKARVFEVPGAGGCLLTESAEYLDEYYKYGNEIEIFQDADDLASKIHHLLEYPEYRDAMAQAGYRRTQAGHTYERRFDEVLKHLPRSQKAVSVDFAAFETIAARHRMDAASRLMRMILMLPFQSIWGKQRGARAARRFLFELSWRLVGKQTYTAAGWPGRWFYRES